MSILQEESDTLYKLEESLWIPETRFDNEYMNKVLADDFFEFGRSGKIYSKEETLSASMQDINITLPLKNFSIKFITDNVALVTYISEVLYEELEIGNRSSLWVKDDNNNWRLQFHQGTVVK